MAIQVRRDRDIHRAGGGWSHAGWHFSFCRGVSLERDLAELADRDDVQRIEVS